MQTTANRLIKERSPYLKGAAHQPVNWYAWSPEVFKEAERLDRPILLDIGAAWCHWCHVIDRESYDNEEIAKFINDHFVAVKVDRDERPDIDSRYQLAVNALTGQGGWPLTVFLTPQGEVFYGGTYFPPEDRYGQPGFKRVLKQIVDLYKNRKSDVLEDAKKINSIFEESKKSPSETPKADLIEGTLYTLKHQFDFTHGGFGNAPKFFHPTALELLIRQYFFNRQSWLRSVIEKTLDAMGKGGVYDQLGGGFHRYSVDERWVVPHFEKMAYDNAALLSIYSNAFQFFGKPFYCEIASGIIRWVRESFSDPAGGFYASQDADINSHDDGDYYTWTQRESEALLAKEEAQALLPYYNIEAQGEMHHDPSRNVLFIAREPEVLARELELKPQEVIKRIESGKRKLLDARKKRKTPFIDQTLYTNWNGAWIRAYFAAYRALRESELKEFALKTLDRFLQKGFQPEKGMARFLADDESPREGFLEDQAEILMASIEAFEITGNTDYLNFAKKLAEILLRRFSAKSGGFYDMAETKEEGHLRFREQRIQDSPSCSPNATAALAFLKLHYLTENPEYLKKVEELLRFFHEETKALSYFAAGYVGVLDFYLKGATKIVIAGKKGDLLFRKLHETALFNFRPYTALFPLAEDSGHLTLDPSLNAVVEEAKKIKRALALVCVGKTCKPLTDSPTELEKQILEIS